ncbi:MAG: TM0106 family RecB-like putative nuclease [Gemmatimonadales bacterium]
MIHAADGTLRFSPADLVAYLEGDFAAWCERMLAERARDGAAGPAEIEWATPDEDEQLALVARKGQEHEDRYLHHVRERHPDLISILRGDLSADHTLAALRAGAPVVYQGHLVVDGWQGYPDFLFRCTGACALGDYHYVPWDTKLARSAKPYFLIQLCAYAEMLDAVQGFRPKELVFVLGNNEERRFSTDHYFYYYRRLKQSFAEFQGAWERGHQPEPGLDRSYGRWTTFAEKLLAESDHLSRVAGISRGQVRRLEEAGIRTLSALAACGAKRVARISEPVLERLQIQARLQLASRDCPRPLWELRAVAPAEPRRGLAQLPPASPNDVFFDMEGFPFVEGGLEYLFGAVAADGNDIAFHDWWAHDDAGERKAFEGFMDWIIPRWRRDPSLHIYHYATYEETAVKKLAGRYATREREVDLLLRNDVFVDLYAVVKQGLIIGTPSYSLKEVERLYLAPREGEVKSGAGSVLEYQRWIDSGEPGEWEASPILKGIRDYNRVDCESTLKLRDWLLERQMENGIAYAGEGLPLRSAQGDNGGAQGGRGVAPDGTGGGEAEKTEAEELAARLLAIAKAEKDRDPERARVTEMVGWLVEFHRREEKPMWWRMFKRHDMSVEELAEDLDCLANLTRTETAPRAIKKSRGLEYRFDAEQDTKLRADSRCYVAGRTDLRCEITAFDGEEGVLELKVGPGKQLEDRLSLIPDEHVPAGVIKDAIARYARAWEGGRVPSQAVDDLLYRRPPRIKGHGEGPLIREMDGLVRRACDLASRLDGGTLCIQGPPGTGKTVTAAAIIVELLGQGKRIGVAANSHKVVLNLMGKVLKAAAGRGVAAGFYKAGKDEEDELIAGGDIQQVESGDVAGVMGDGPVLVGGTAWVFSREDLEGSFDYLFIDEAGQVSLANAVAMGRSTRNLILVGDQMQLGQPSQASHPGETGLSCLEYLLHGHATVPPDAGIFLGRSYRMHDGVCRFISDAVYDGRLGSAPETARHRVVRGKDSVLVPAETGVVWVPVSHDDCDQWSEEECRTIAAIAGELLRRTVVGRDGVERPMTAADILVVAPFNLQVRKLRDALGPGARVGSVDKFQGQEAPVVIVSLCASSIEDASRGAEFLLNPNRLNVAVSRAEALAIVVGSPELMRVRCRSVEEMKLVNLLCHLVQYAEGRA